MKNQNRRNKRLGSKKLLLVLIAVVLLAALGFFIYLDRANNQIARETNPSGTENINNDGPTDVDKQEAEDHKQSLVDNKQATPPPTNDKQNVTPVFGYIDQADNGNIIANGSISEAVESDGTCTLTLERNGVKVSKSKQAMPDAQSTICGQIIIERSQLSAGEWKATLSYSSAKYKGISGEKTIQVQ